MKIFIQGRKDGYNVLYPKLTPVEFFQFASDIQRIDAECNVRYYGKSIYSIAFTGNGCIFSKFIIGCDVQRSNLGNIGISIFIPSTQKLASADVKTLLDELVTLYIKNYCPDFYIDNSKQEDWLLFNMCADNYDPKLCNISGEDVEGFGTGAADPAFIYYSSDVALQKYFDAPYQEEYIQYKQIYFIEKKLENNIGNPLNVFRHDISASLTDKIDLENRYYYLSNYNRSKGVTITTDGKLRSDGKNNNCIRAKWQIEIKYSKDDKCYMPIQVCGTLSNPDSEISKYLEINGNQIKIKYDAFSNPIPKTKRVTFEAKDRNGKRIDDVEIVYKTDYQQETTATDYIVFKGEDVIKKWTILAKKGDNFVSEEIPVIPGERDTVEIRMHEIKRVEITVTNETGIVYDFKVSCSSASFDSRTSLLEFRDEKIEEECHIEVSKNEGKENYFGKKEFHPKSESKICIDLTRESEKQIYMGEHGSASVGYSNKEDGSPVAQYEKKTPFYKKNKFIIGSVGLLFLAIVGFGLWGLLFFPKNNLRETLLTPEKITGYVDDNDLNLDTLDYYKKHWKEKERLFIKKTGFRPFDGKKDVDSTEWKNDWQPINKRIEQAIDKRNAINAKEIFKLRSGVFEWSGKQQDFKTAISNINDSVKAKEIADKLGDVYLLSLTQIADSINSILTLKGIIKTEQLQEERKELQPARSATPSTQEHKPVAQPSTDNTSEIIQYLKSGELSKATLENYKKQTNNSNLRTSIDLALKFWSLNSDTNNSYSSYQNDLKKDDILNNSELKNIVDAQCEKIELKPKYVVELPEIDRVKKINDLKNKLQ